jgi:adenosylcobinamide kinase/adenosylcobinamide-phosphate guanylyltransferase
MVLFCFMGGVPMGESTRLYVDFCGWLNQGVAKLADKVTLITAGIPLVIKDTVDN